MEDQRQNGPFDAPCQWQFKKTIVSRDKDVRDVLLEIEDGLLGAGCSADGRHATQIVLAEILNNIVEHAYTDQCSGEIGVALRLRNGSVTAELRDRGKEMPKGSLPGDEFPNLEVHTLEDLPEGGFGWAMVRHLTESLSYARIRDQNILSFRVGCPR